MKTYINPAKETWTEILKRPLFDVSDLYGRVQAILNEIKNDGDTKLREYTEKFDGVKLDSFVVSQSEIAEAESLVAQELKDAIALAAKNITTFHTAQKPEIKKTTTTTGVTCWQKAVAIEKVGLYVPGGTAPLFSTVLMLAIPAQIADCKEIVLCSPPNKQGKIHPAILYAAKVAGVTQIYKLGGVQAIGAMAYGTETVPKTYKIFGPGNQYVMAAKQLVSMNEVSIDMPAGPSEVLVVADETSNPAFVASDLLSQAEHGVDSQVVLVANRPDVIDRVKAEVNAQLAVLPRKAIAEKALCNSILIVLQDEQERIDLINEYAPEHLILSTENYIELSEKVTNAGSVFLGQLTPESAGDYASGTNHTLPTNGWARSYSGVNLHSFLKLITFQEITKEGLQNIGQAIELMAATEELDAHKNAVTIRTPQPPKGGAQNGNMFYGAEPILFEFAKELRNNPTEAENFLWKNLSDKNLGVRFKRQHPVLYFIADFYCHKAKLIIEVDGGYHQIPEQYEYDSLKDAELESLGLKVIRFSNEQVLFDIETTLKKIEKELKQRTNDK